MGLMALKMHPYPETVAILISILGALLPPLYGSPQVVIEPSALRAAKAYIFE
jgi:hypothetical protein